MFFCAVYFLMSLARTVQNQGRLSGFKFICLHLLGVIYTRVNLSFFSAVNRRDKWKGLALGSVARRQLRVHQGTGELAVGTPRTRLGARTGRHSLRCNRCSGAQGCRTGASATR